MQSTWSAKTGVQNKMNMIGLISDSDLKQSWYDLIEAFVEGAQLDNLVKNSTVWVKEVQNGNDDMYKVFYNIYWYGWTWEYYLDFNGALGDLTPIIRTCYDVVDNSTIGIKSYVSKFKNFADFALQAKDNWVKNMFTWYDIYSKISDAIATERPTDIANQVGRAFRLFFDFVPNQSNLSFINRNSLPDFNPIQDFIVGFLNGTKVISSESITKWIKEIGFVVESFDDGNRCFQNGTADPFRWAMFEVADVAEHLRPFNEECYNGGNDIYQTIWKYIDTFKSPMDLVFNALRHIYDIFNDGVAFYQHIINSNWKAAGFDLGDIVYNVFIDQRP